MSKKTVKYYAQQDLSIQAHTIRRGELIGTGDVEAGDFKAAPGLERFVEAGHVMARLERSLIATDEPEPLPPGGGTALRERKQAEAQRDKQRSQDDAEDLRAATARIEEQEEQIDAAASRIEELEAANADNLAKLDAAQAEVKTLQTQNADLQEKLTEAAAAKKTGSRGKGK